MSFHFTITKEAVARIPNAIICHFENLTVLPPEKSPMYDSIVEKLVGKIKSLKNDLLPSQEVAGFRELYKAMPAGERLLSSIERKGAFPRYNNLVDAINIASAESITPLGSHDVSNEQGCVHLKITDGTEQMIPSFQKKKKKFIPNEFTYGIIKEGNFVPLAWLGTEDVDNRDFQIKDTTTKLFVTVIGHHKTSLEHNVSLAHRIFELIQMSCPAATMTLLEPKLVD